MVNITKEQYEEYMNLKKKEEIQEEMIAQGPESTTKWRQDLNTTRGYAGVFAKILYDEWEKRNHPEYFVLDRWSRVKKYIPEFLLERKDGKWYLKSYFRECLRDYGFGTKIDRKFGLFEIIRII